MICVQDPAAAMETAAVDEDVRSEEGRGPDGDKPEAEEQQEAEDVAAATDDGPAQMDVDTDAGTSTVC
jgi:hypothetical protein